MIYLVVDGGHQPRNNRGGAGAVLVETTGAASDLLCLGSSDNVLAHRGWAFPALSSRIAEARAILQGIQWARATLGPSSGSLLVFSDCHEAINRIQSGTDVPSVLGGTIVTYLPTPMRTGRGNPHMLCHWLATAAQGHHDGDIVAGDGPITMAQIDELILSGPLSSGKAGKSAHWRRNNKSRRTEFVVPPSPPPPPAIQTYLPIDPVGLAASLAELRRHDPPHLRVAPAPVVPPPAFRPQPAPRGFDVTAWLSATDLARAWYGGCRSAA